MRKFFGILGWTIILGFSIVSFTLAYTQEEIAAYNRAYKNGITTQSSIDAANLDGKLTRQELSKMLTNYIENVAGVSQTSYSSCTFTDENSITPNLKPYTRKICSYKIMGSNGEDFRPTSKVTRAELGTTISRMLWGDAHDVSGKDFYVYHLNALKDAGIMNNINNPTKSLARRGDTFIMLKRLSDKYGSNINLNGSKISNSSSTKTSDNNSVTRKTDKNGFSYYDSYLDNPRLSNTMKDMKLRSTYCPNIFCQQVADDGTYNNQKHYYWNDDEGTMTLIPGVYYVSDCEYYDKLYGNNNSFTKIEDDSKSEKTVSKSDSNAIYAGKNGTEYDYNKQFIKGLKAAAEKKGESELAKYLEIEAKYYIDETESFDLDNLSELLGIDEDLDPDTMTKREKEALLKEIKNGINKIVRETKNNNNKYLDELKKLIKNIDDDKFGLKEKYEKTEGFVEVTNNFLDLYSEIIVELMEIALTANEEEISDEEGMAIVFGLMGSALVYQSETEQYESYLENWAQNTIKLLGGESNSFSVTYNPTGSSSAKAATSQGRARDVARKNDLAQVQTAIITSQQDRGMWPGMSNYYSTTGAAEGMRISDVSNNLYKAGMSSIPSDPVSSSIVYGLGEKYNTKTNATRNGAEGDYLYLVSTRNGVKNGGFVLMAKTETEGGSNWVVCENSQSLDKGYITNSTDLREVNPCYSLTKGNSCSASACTYTDEGQLRYILLY